MKLYPSNIQNNIESLVDCLKYICRTRKEDINDYDNLVNVFMSGRKVGKIPTSSADVISTDKIGDFSYSTTYLYICVDNAGSAVWRRISLGSW